MATSKKFSELPAASSVGNGDLFAIAHEDAQAETGYVSQKLTAAQAGQKVNGDTEYPTSLPSFPTGYQNPFDALEKLNSDIDSLYPVVTETGSIANFTTSLALPLVECKANIVAQQAGSGTPSPQNVRSISGFSSVSFYHTGKNLFDPAVYSSFLQLDGKYRGSANSIVAVRTNVGVYIGKQLTFSVYADLTISPTPTNVKVAVNINGITTTGNPIESSNAGYSSVTFTPQSENDFVLITFGSLGGNSYIFYDIQLEASSTRTAYEAYDGETKTIALGQTVYGGSVDAKNGKATITHGYKDLGDFTWRKSSSGIGRFYASSSRTEFPYLLTKTTQMLCSMYAFDGYSSSLQNIYGPNGTFRYWYATTETAPSEIYVCDESKDTLDATQFKDAMSGVQLVYELATPIEITGLTPANFTTFADQENNIFSDCGDISVSFKQGIQEYIDAKIAETQALIL